MLRLRLFIHWGLGERLRYNDFLVAFWQGLVVEKNKEELIEVDISERVIKSLIHVIRGQQVMIDSDLAMLYQVETKTLNRAVKRNINRFPEDFCFRLSKDEYLNLKCQFGTSSLDTEDNTNEHGGRRKLPYAFTEQGISMLSTVLRSETAVKVSIGIMRAFVEM